MIKFYQTEWFGISFRSFTNLNTKKIADKSFYELFYQEFYKRFDGFDSLPETYKSRKRDIASLLSGLCIDDNMLSIGCGNGFVEYCLAKDHKKKIVSYEPSIKRNISWLNNVPNVELYEMYFTAEAEKQPRFAYASLVEYSMDDCEYLYFLKTIRNSKVDTFCLIEPSIYKENMKSTIKDKLKSVFAFFFPRSWQLWGYLRTKSEHQEIFVKAGFSSYSFHESETGLSYVMLSKK